MRGGIALLVVVLSSVSLARAGCIDWEVKGPYADVEAASAVFEGIVAKVEVGDVASCAPDRVTFTVVRQWKGTPTKEITLLQENGGFRIEKSADGRVTWRGCPVWSEADVFREVGKRYIVLATRVRGELKAMGCGTSKPPSRRERRRLAKWEQTQAAER